MLNTILDEGHLVLPQNFSQKQLYQMLLSLDDQDLLLLEERFFRNGHPKRESTPEEIQSQESDNNGGGEAIIEATVRQQEIRQIIEASNDLEGKLRSKLKTLPVDDYERFFTCFQWDVKIQELFLKKQQAQSKRQLLTRVPLKELMKIFRFECPDLVLFLKAYSPSLTRITNINQYSSAVGLYHIAVRSIYPGKATELDEFSLQVIAIMEKHHDRPFASLLELDSMLRLEIEFGKVEFDQARYFIWLAELSTMKRKWEQPANTPGTRTSKNKKVRRSDYCYRYNFNGGQGKACGPKCAVAHKCLKCNNDHPVLDSACDKNEPKWSSKQWWDSVQMA